MILSAQSICPECAKPFTQPKRKQGGGGRKKFCSEHCRMKVKSAKPASREYQKNWQRNKRRKDGNGASRNKMLLRNYGITEAAWNKLFEQQGHACAICRTQTAVSWHTDHDHDSGKVRGVLCANCNRGLGMYKDDISFLRRAAAYLGQHQGILGANAIRNAKLITPFKERTIRHGMSYGASMAGYDLRIDQNLILLAKDFKLASSVEYFDMPNDLVGMIYDKSSYARRGLQAFNTIVEPGWKGYLTIELFNASDRPIKLMKGDPIVQVVFSSLDAPTEQPYSGKYQNQRRGPVHAILEV